MDELPPQTEVLACLRCRTESEADVNFCFNCGTALRPGWVCWECCAFNGEDTAKCISCGRFQETPARCGTERQKLLIGTAFIGLTLMTIGYCLVSDIIHNRHFLSTKDGRFHQITQALRQ